MSKITKDDVLYTANLAHLNVSAGQADKLTGEMENIINFANMLSEINFDDFSCAFGGQVQNVFRSDIVTSQNRQEAMLANAPKVKAGCYCVPKVIDED